MEISEVDLIKEIQGLMLNERLVPEPQFSSFSKYLATIYEKSNNSIVYLANSQGVHLRKDVNYLLQRRSESTENSKNKCPITEPTHLDLFKDYNDLITKLKELPSEWTVVQITNGFSPYTAVGSNMDADSSISIARFPCGEIINQIPPYHITIETSKQSQGNLMAELGQLIKARRDYYKTGITSKKLREEYIKTDNGLMSFVNEFENHCLKEWRCLLNGRLEDSSLETETKIAVKQAIDNFFKKQNKLRKLDEKNLDIIYLATISAHVMKNSDLLRVLSYVLKENENESLNEFFPLMENLKLINLSNGCAVKRADKKPVILIIDPIFEEAPWEMISTLQGQPVCRILSLHLLYALFKYHEDSIVDGYYRLVSISNAYSLVNPERDLDKCEKCLKNFLNKEFPWVVADLGKKPDPQVLLSRLQEYNIYFYCGHGSGTQYLNPSDLKKAIIKGMIMLFGCCSNLPKSTGGRTPYQNHTYTYIINGCPCLVGCLHDVNSTETDAVCLDMLSTVMPVFKNEGGKKVVNEPKEPDVLKALVAAKKKCNKYWTTCSFVARGIPCKTAAGDFDS